jgi:hypothetical protein
MERDSYSLAGWAAIGSVVLFVPVMGLLIYNDMQSAAFRGARSGPDLLPVVIALDVASKVLAIYAYLRFRDLLNHRYDFHAVDRLIPILIVAGVLTGAFSYAARAFGSPAASIAMGIMTAMIMGVLGAVYSRRLLRMSGNLNGYLKPLAYTCLTGSVCFILVVLAPVGLILFRAAEIIMALAFFKGDELEELEVV